MTSLGYSTDGNGIGILFQKYLSMSCTGWTINPAFKYQEFFVICSRSVIHSFLPAGANDSSGCSLYYLTSESSQKAVVKINPSGTYFKTYEATSCKIGVIGMRSLTNIFLVHLVFSIKPSPHTSSQSISRLQSNLSITQPQKLIRHRV